MRLDSEERALNWGRRLLHEELGIENSGYNSANLRALSVFLEAPILNCAICCALYLDLTEAEVDTIIRAKPKRDWEFQRWEFTPLSSLTSLLLEPSMEFHPTAGYWMLMLLIHRHGATRLMAALQK